MAENADSENSFYKGANFELLFAEFMKSDLGWDGYVIRSDQKAKSKGRGSNVDIIGKRKDDRGRRLYTSGLIEAIIGLGGVVIAIILEQDGYNEFSLYAIIFGIGLMLGGIFTIWYSRNYHQENAWVECKNKKTKATIEEVQKCLNEWNDYRKSGDKEYKYVVKYFASANGFVGTALKLAEDNDIICFIYKDEKFEQVKYWQ